MPTGVEPPVVAQSARPRAATASPSASAMAVAAAREVASASGRTSMRGSVVIGPCAASGDEPRGGGEDVGTDRVLARRLDRLSEEIRLALPGRREAALG